MFSHQFACVLLKQNFKTNQNRKHNKQEITLSKFHFSCTLDMPRITEILRFVLIL